MGEGARRQPQTSGICGTVQRSSFLGNGIPAHVCGSGLTPPPYPFFTLLFVFLQLASHHNHPHHQQPRRPRPSHFESSRVDPAHCPRAAPVLRLSTPIWPTAAILSPYAPGIAHDHSNATHKPSQSSRHTLIPTGVPRERVRARAGEGEEESEEEPRILGDLNYRSAEAVSPLFSS